MVTVDMIRRQVGSREHSVMRAVACVCVVAAGAGFAIVTWRGPATTGPQLRQAERALEYEYLTNLQSKLARDGSARCQHVTYERRHIAWCGFRSDEGRIAARGYWELDGTDHDVLIYAMNGEALRALQYLADSRFKPGYERPFLDLNALDAAYPD